MQNSLQRGPPVLMEADNFVLNLAVSIWWIKLYCCCYFPINYFDFMKEEILVCFLFELIATLALLVGFVSLSLGLPLKEFLVMTSELGTILPSALLKTVTLESMASDLLDFSSTFLSL